MSDDTSVQVAIGIKIFPGAMTKRRVAILHQRGQPTQEVDFGYGYPPAPPLTFPVGAIYAGVALPAGLNGNHPISINLDELRTVINITLHRSNN
ncbi:hypothetical protein P3T76_015240 [Phytophthora citrophthora]|uniref:Uncharacterized protein n=1 Tax=Phytophthora citrophthora TaxID=4793 RepID=A0AAD9LAG0_9STRA|nr:hypothetical protein P3T76_015240 [Phytophthora citrophthora]